MKHKALNAEQRKLVADNLGLVAVHLKRRVPGLRMPTRQREYDDLFQEGCMGLMQAAQDFDPKKGIPFAAFAFPRIKQAVYRALASKFTLINIPVGTRDRARRMADTQGDYSINEESDSRLSFSATEGTNVLRAHEHHTPIKSSSQNFPQVYSLIDSYPRGMEPFTKVVTNEDTDSANVDQRKLKQVGAESAETTIAERIRKKYERAVRTAGDIVADSKTTRNDKSALIRILIEQRLLIPEEEEKRSLRQIARDTASSPARVSQCERRVIKVTGELLQTDPEFRVLDRWMRTVGPATRLIEIQVQNEIHGECASQLVELYSCADSLRRAEILDVILEATRNDIELVILNHLLTIEADARERVLSALQPHRTKPAARRRAS